MPRAVGRVSGDDRRYAITLHPDFVRMHVQEQMNILFRSDDLQLLLVVVVHGRLGVSAKTGVEFPDEIAQGRIGRLVYLSVEMNTNLRAIVTAEHGTVLYQRHLQPEPSR